MISTTLSCIFEITHYHYVPTVFTLNQVLIYSTFVGIFLMVPIFNLEKLNSLENEVTFSYKITSNWNEFYFSILKIENQGWTDKSRSVLRSFYKSYTYFTINKTQENFSLQNIKIEITITRLSDQCQISISFKYPKWLSYNGWQRVKWDWDTLFSF